MEVANKLTGVRDYFVTHQSIEIRKISVEKLQGESQVKVLKTERLKPKIKIVGSTEKLKRAVTEIKVNSIERINFLNKPEQSTTENGGIDFNPNNSNLSAQGSEESMTFNVDPAMLQRMQNATSVTPVIVGVRSFVGQLTRIYGC